VIAFAAGSRVTRSPLSFRRFLPIATISVLAVALFVGCHAKHASPVAGLTPLRLQLDWYPQPEHGGFYTALMLGYYKAEGLDVTIIPLPQYGSVAQLVATGRADVGLGSSDQVLEWNSNGLPLVAVSATMQHDPQAVMVHKDSPIRDFKDLEGRTIAAQTGATWLKYVISRYNLHNVRQIPSTLSIANFLADPGYVQQIFVTSEPFFAKQAGADVRTFLISSSGYDPYRVQFTTRDFAARNEDVLRRFVRAGIRGWQEYLRNPEPTNDYLLKLNPALNPTQEAFTAQALREGGFVSGEDPTGAQIGRMTSDRWQMSYRQLKSLEILNGPFDPGAAYSLSFVQ
jgi:NitT/TauT family transport system substrate-binding protein